MTPKNLFKTAFLLCGLLSTGTLFAQNQQPAKAQKPTAPKMAAPEARAKEQTDQMQQTLSLTPEQNQKAYAINLAHAQAVDNIRSAGGSDVAKKTEEARTKKVSDLKALLTPEQFQKFQSHGQAMNAPKKPQANPASQQSK